MTQPERAPVNPRPITHDLQHGQVQAVVTFRLANAPDDDWIKRIHQACLDSSPEVLDGTFSIGLRVIGAGGETSEDEGRYDHPSALANLDDIPHVRPTSDVPTEGKL